VTGLRAWLHAHRNLAALAIAAALLVRLLIPAGFMPSNAPGTLLVQLCSGAGGTMVTITLPKGEDGTQAAKPCAFAELAMPVLGATDPVVLALAQLAAFALAMLPQAAPGLRRPAFVLPPPRGPPSII
jgi:hypothetical protein